MKRPKVKIKLDTIDTIIEALGVIALLVLITLPLYYFDQLPNEIPSHYGASGKPDEYSEKGIIWTLPIVGVILYLGIFWLNKYPHIFNYPQQITEGNALRLYTVATKIIRFLNTQMSIAFAYLTYSTIQTSLGRQDGISSHFLLIFLLSNFLLLGYLLYKYTKK